MTLAGINALDEAEFVAALGAVFEHSPWIAQRAFAARPFASVDALHRAMMTAVERGSDAERLALIRAHPELAGRAAVRGELTVESAREQSGAGLAECSPDEYARLADLNARYLARFRFPFVLAVKGYDRAGIIDEFARRLDNDRDSELAESIAQIARIARFRLEALVSAG